MLLGGEQFVRPLLAGGALRITLLPDKAVQRAKYLVPCVGVLLDPGHDRLLLHSGDYKGNSAVRGPVPVQYDAGGPVSVCCILLLAWPHREVSHDPHGRRQACPPPTQGGVCS